MKKIIFIIIVSNSFLLSCNTVRESAGVGRKVIDEYSVIENPPLIIPPNFNLLPPDQIESKKIEDTESDLAKEILFGLDDSKSDINSENSLIFEIIEATEANEVDENIRQNINQEFAGEKSSIKDEIIFENEDQLNKAIESTKNKGEKNIIKKEKKKKRFFFF